MYGKKSQPSHVIVHRLLSNLKSQSRMVSHFITHTDRFRPSLYALVRIHQFQEELTTAGGFIVTSLQGFCYFYCCILLRHSLGKCPQGMNLFLTCCTFFPQGS